MSRLTIKRITLTVASLLGAALVGFSALFVQANQAMARARLGAATVPAVQAR